MFLVDTNIVSESSPLRQGYARLLAWMDRNTDLLFISVITVAELVNGIAELHRRGGVRRAERLSEWLDGLLLLHRRHVVPLDIEIARALGTSMDRAKAAGLPQALPDLAIAATARVRRYTVLTRNVRHFTGLGVDVLDPYVQLPPG